MAGVSIHAPTWGATMIQCRFIQRTLVSIHAPTWGATDHRACSAHSYRGFNPRSHMGSDDNDPDHHDLKRVSIHAPTWGATQRTYQDVKQHRVSIHAPTWGATQAQARQRKDGKFQSTLPHGERLSAYHQAYVCNRFNPRSHMGSDLLLYPLVYARYVSIHAPTWGATVHSL